MKKAAFPVIALLILVVAMSGCLENGQVGTTPITGGTGTAGTKGIEIIEFSSLSYVEEGNLIDVNLRMENAGGGTASNVSVDMFQHADFKVHDGTFNQSLEGTLLPPDLERGLLGEDWPLFWVLRAPMVTSNTNKNVKARITYTYESSSSTNAYLVSKAEYDEKGAESFSTYTTSTEGPMTIKIVPLPPFKIADPSLTSKEVEFDIIFENTGNGVVENDKVYDFVVELDGEPVACKGMTATEISLWGKNQERGIECELDLSFPGASVSHIVEVSAKYDYHFDTQPLTIEVQDEE